MAYIAKGCRDMLILVACTIYLSCISCAEINKGLQLSDDYDFWRRKYFTTTESDDFWWKRYTTEPLDDRYTKPTSRSFGTNIALIIFVIVVLLMVLWGLIYCWKYVYKSTRSTVSSPTPSRLTIPRPRTIPPPENTRASAQQSPTPVASAPPFFSIFREQTDGISTNLSHFMEQTGGISTNLNNFREQSGGISTNLNNSTDKPPAYEEVALSDFNAQETKYPEVKPSVPENPPPKYDEDGKLKN